MTLMAPCSTADNHRTGFFLREKLSDLGIMASKVQDKNPGNHLLAIRTNIPEDYDDPSALIVLAEEELVAIDLKTAGWPVIQSPYLVSLHCSAITCSHHISNIPLKLWERTLSAGAKQSVQYSNMPWPIDGGVVLGPDPPQRDLLLTGHEDGTVRFWDASGVCLRLMYKMSTVGVFLTDADHNDNLNQQEGDEWPPLRKVGSFDPYSDDPRLGIQKIYLCKYSGYLAIAGTAGQVWTLYKSMYLPPIELWKDTAQSVMAIAGLTRL